MLYINGREVLLSVQVGGTWSVLSGTWTLPAFTMGGDITGAGKCITNLAGLTVNGQVTLFSILFADYHYISAYAVDDSWFGLRARDNGVGFAAIAIAQSAVWAHLKLTRAKFGTSAIAANANTRGGLYVTEGGAGVPDKLFIIMKNTADGYEAVQVSTGS